MHPSRRAAGSLLSGRFCPTLDPSMSATRARRPWASRLLLFLGVLLVGAEVAVRLDDWRAGRDRDFYLSPKLFEEGVYLPHPYLGVVLKPGYERAGEYSFHINSLGMRSAEMSAQKPPE